MKINKFIISIFSLIIILFYGCQEKFNKKSLNNISWIRFYWEGDSIGNRYFDKLAMSVPFQMEGIPYKFRSQLDLGAPMTMIYGNSFEPLLSDYPHLKEKLDTVNKKYMIQGKKVGGFGNIVFYLDTVRFTHQNIAYFQGFGDKPEKNNLKTDTTIHIGTIGLNLFKEKVLVIDFKNQKLAVLDSLPNDMEKEMVDIVIENGRIKVPVVINGKKVYVLYDTGTSIASLFLSTYNWNKYRDTTSTLDTIMATAWGTELPILISKTNIEVQIGNNIFKPKKIMANNLRPYYEFYKREKIIGLMGNKLFYGKVLIIDLKNQKFGILNNQQLTKNILHTAISCKYGS